MIKVFAAKTTTRTHFSHYDDNFDFNSNIKIMQKNVDESVYIKLLNRIIHNLMHSEYLLMSKKTALKSDYIQLTVNRSNNNFSYTK